VSFPSGALVKVRDREWVVLPGSSDELLLLRPLGGTDDETTGILTGLEQVDPARFDWPDPARPGDYRSARMLRDALRLGFRSSAGPFRSFGSIAVEPRPYQLVPLLMALRQDITRLLIADDVGIGKTIEALLIAGELLATGTVTRLAVLCPPHLAEQWHREMAEKFHIGAELVLPSTAPRLERRTRVGQSLFDLYPFVVVSTDFIKAERRRAEFLRACPELVIVDEAHTCAADPDRRGARHQRHDLVAGLAADPTRHLLLVTATPHSGDEGAFRSLLALTDPSLADLPSDLSGEANAPLRRRLARFLVQRRRQDIERYLDTTEFPKRDPLDAPYTLHEDYRRLFERAIAYARETVADTTGGQHRQRVRWWSALALLRSLASSPAAAAATLRARADTAETTTVEEADQLGRRMVLDAGDEDTVDSTDTVLGANPAAGDTTMTDDPTAGRVHRRLLEMARLADDLAGERDHKLAKLTGIVDELLAEGYSPLVFCRFIPTAEYVAAQLRQHVKERAEVVAVTGMQPPAEREQRVSELAEHPARVLVATDCLSEGINLQEHFDAVVHYDLSWNPTRHEQREGRADRYGQPREIVKVVTMYGTDNAIDGIVLDVLLRKHQKIRKSLGVAVPVPAGTAEVIEAIFEGLLLRERSGGTADVEQLVLFDEFVAPKRIALHDSWEAAAEREKRASLFAQTSIKVDEVASELAAARAAVGSAADVAGFVRAAVTAHGGHVAPGPRNSVQISLAHTPAALRDAVGGLTSLSARFELPVRDGETYLSRTHPFVEGLASHVLTNALDGLTDSPAARAGVTRTAAVTKRTTLLLIRHRFDIVTIRGGEESVLLAEDTGVLAFAGPSGDPQWLGPEAVTPLLAATPDGNVAAEQATGFLSQVFDAAPTLINALDIEAQSRAEELLATHRRVRTETGVRGVRYRVTPHLPVDVLGVYVLLPMPMPTPGAA
jgi:superfamily II DNA or RNA helicase